MRECVSTISMLGNHMCSTHHWPMDECGGRACRAGVWDFDRASRNIAFAIACVACITACGVGPNGAHDWYRLGHTTAYTRKVLVYAGLWEERG